VGTGVVDDEQVRMSGACDGQRAAGSVEHAADDGGEAVVAGRAHDRGELLEDGGRGGLLECVRTHRVPQ
jgi:hypothetical protein